MKRVGMAIASIAALLAIYVFAFPDHELRSSLMPICLKVLVQSSRNEIPVILGAIEEFATARGLTKDDRSVDASRLMGREVVFVTFSDGPPINDIIVVKNLDESEGVSIEMNSKQPPSQLCNDFQDKTLPLIEARFAVSRQ